MKEKVRINVAVSAATYEKLRQLAYEQRISIPALIRQAVDKHISS